MARYALVTNGTVIVRMASDVDPTVQTKSGSVWLPCNPVAPPTFNPLTEKITGPTYAIGASSVTEIWTKVSLTAQEISDAKDAAVGQLNGSLYAALANGLLNHENRIRALESKTPITMAQFKAGVKALI